MNNKEQNTVTEIADDEKKTAAVSQRRVMKSGPKIYGQGDQNDFDPSAYGPQGVIRKTVLGGSPYNGTSQFIKYEKGSGEFMSDTRNMENAFDTTAIQEEDLNQEPGMLEESVVETEEIELPNVEEPEGDFGEPEEIVPEPVEMNEEDFQKDFQKEEAPFEEPPRRPVRRTQSRPVMVDPQGRPIMVDPQGRPVMRNTQSRPVMVDPQGRPIMRNPQGRTASQFRPMGGAQAQYNTRVMKTARGAIKSPLFVLIVLFNIAAAAGAILTVLMKQMNYALYANAIAKISVPENVASYVDKFTDFLKQLESGQKVINLVLQTPAVLFALGLLLVLICALFAKEKMAGIGFLFMKIVTILRMIASCIVMLAFLIVAVAILIAAWVGESKTMLTVAIIVLAAAIIITMFVVMYYFCYLATIKTVRINANKGESYGKVSGYVAIVSIIASLFGIIGILSGVVNNEIANVISGVGTVGWQLLFGLWLFSYRGKMKRLGQQ